MGLPKRFEFCVGAPVLLLHNLAVEHGLMNCIQGQVVEIQYAEGAHPNHERLQLRMPSVIVVDFPGFTGPAFFDCKDQTTFVPLMPRTITARDDNDAGRTQFPLTLAWALTPWKAQGMTLAKALLHITHAAASPGVLFTAMTRVRHPDTLMLDDEFPSYGQVMKVRINLNVQ